jgi:DNA-binding beta-propeller fold protein YncE
MQWVAPEKSGTYEIAVRVDDGKGGSAQGEVAMEVSPVGETDPYGLVSVVGGNSKAAWQFGEVTDVEIDDRDNMWVLDAKSNLLRTISPAGVRLGAIDLTRGGSGFGIAPSKIRVGKGGIVHVLDISHKTLDRLAANDNSFDTVFDGSNRKAFLLDTPSDVEVTPSGDMLVTDSAEGHVVAIDEGGRFVLLFASQGTGRGQLVSPVSITTNKFGDIYVLDSGKDEILAFDRAFRFRAAYSCPMEDESGEIVADGRGGSVFLLDSGAGSVRKLDEDGKLKTHIGSIKGKDSSGPVATSMAVGSDGRTLIGTANASIWEFDSIGALRGILGEENFGKVPSIAATDDGTLFVLDSSLAQVKRFDRHGWLRGRFGEKGKYEGQFQKPARICVDGEGNCYIFDSGTSCIQRFTGTGAFDKLLSAGEDVAGNLKDAIDIDTQKDGSIYILDDRRKAVFILSRDGELKKIVPLTSSDARSGSEIKRPAHVAVDGQGTIYVSDPSQYVVYKFDAEGKRIQTLGGKGKGPGEFGKVGDLAADRLGCVYVLLTDRGTVAKFDGNGRFLMEIALKVGKDESLKKPEVVAVDSLGSLYVYDDYYQAVFKFMQ